MIEKAFRALKPGGILYIKDLFKREHPNEEDGKKIDRIVDEINKAYCYHVADLHEVLAAMRKLNFILLFVKTPEVKTEEFEHLSISNDFQNLFDMDQWKHLHEHTPKGWAIFHEYWVPDDNPEFFQSEFVSRQVRPQ